MSAVPSELGVIRSLTLLLDVNDLQVSSLRILQGCFPCKEKFVGLPHSRRCIKDP